MVVWKKKRRKKNPSSILLLHRCDSEKGGHWGWRVFWENFFSPQFFFWKVWKCSLVQLSSVRWVQITCCSPCSLALPLSNPVTAVVNVVRVKPSVLCPSPTRGSHIFCMKAHYSCILVWFRSKTVSANNNNNNTRFYPGIVETCACNCTIAVNQRNHRAVPAFDSHSCWGQHKQWKLEFNICPCNPRSVSSWQM